MDLFVLLPILLLTATAATTTASNGSGRCSHWCKRSFAPHPFGFSGDCPILLACNPAIKTPLLPGSTAAASYPILSFDSSASTFVVAMAPSCKRSVSETKASLSGSGYGVSPAPASSSAAAAAARRRRIHPPAAASHRTS
ncbi:unnamed protein product [Urochloa humidicola]